MAALRGLRRLLCVLPLVALAACSGIGKGDKVEYLQMLSVVGTTKVALPTNYNLISYQCLRQQLGILAVFGHNGSADYTARPGTTWTSSRPDIVAVSNGDQLDPVNPGRVFPKGVITPLSAGTATITANYVGVTTSIQVTVTEPDSIILSTSQYDTTQVASEATAPDSTVPAPQPISIGVGTTQQYFAYAKLRDQNGVTTYQDETGNAVWSIVGDSQGSFATITNPAVGTTSGGGLVTGVAASGGPLTINANFAACPSSQFANIMAQVQVANVVSVAVQHDPNFLAITNPGYTYVSSAVPAAPPPTPAKPPNSLVVGNSEAFVVTGKLDNGAFQDLSLQSVLSTEFGASGVIGFAGNVATASATPGSTLVDAIFTVGTTQIRSPTIPVQTVNAQFSNYVIAPADRNVMIPTQGFHMYRAQAQFSTGPTSFIQDVTHNTVWTTSSAADVVIGNAGELVGVAISQRSVEACVNVTGTYLGDLSGNTSYLTGLGIGIGVSPTGCSQ